MNELISSSIDYQMDDNTAKAQIEAYAVVQPNPTGRATDECTKLGTYIMGLLLDLKNKPPQETQEWPARIHMLINEASLAVLAGLAVYLSGATGMNLLYAFLVYLGVGLIKDLINISITDGLTCLQKVVLMIVKFLSVVGIGLINFAGSKHLEGDKQEGLRKFAFGSGFALVMLSYAARGSSKFK